MRTQLERLATYVAHHPAITLPIENVNFQVVRIRGEERISSPYDFIIDIVPSTERSASVSILPAEDIIGQAGCLSLLAGELGDEAGREIHGIIREFRTIPDASFGDRPLFRLRLVPQLSLWDLNVGFRMFEQFSVDEIVEALAGQHQLALINRVSSGLPKHRYRCQYEESDLNFFTRLLESEGISYFFRRDEAEHSLVLADSENGFDELDPMTASIGHSITSWATEYQLAHGRQSVCGYDPIEAESFNRSETTVLNVSHNQELHEMRQWPGTDNRNQAQASARIEMERAEKRFERHRGRSVRSDFAAGCYFELRDHSDANFNQLYLLTNVSHAYDVQAGYRNSFTCIPMSTNTYVRPERTAARPAIRGPQPAIVVNEPPDPDNLGAVQVQFPWNGEETCQCWIRFAENAAGSNRGTWFPPRVDDEVIVEFLNGDPDRPVITGRLYNGRNTPSENDAAITSIQTQSGHQLRFDDNTDNPQVLLHSANNVKVVADGGEIIVENASGSQIKMAANGEITINSPSKLVFQAANIEAHCGMMQVNSGFTKVSGVLQCDTLISNAVVSASYTPGAGNIW